MIGIVGNGFVGNAVYQNVRDKAPTKVYDVDKNRSFSTLEEVLEQQYIFICLPTPMRMDGSCDLSILDKFFEDVDAMDLDILKEQTFIIKSTVPIGTTRKYAEKYELLSIAHNPEFLKIIRFVVKDANVFVISHKAGMDDRFDSVLKYEKIKGFSRLAS